MSDFENINYKIELEVQVYLLEKENFELRGQLIDKLLLMKQLKTNSKCNTFTAGASTTITSSVQTNNKINSDNNNNTSNSNKNNTSNNNCKNKNNNSNNSKNNKIRKTRRNNNNTNENGVYNKKLEAQMIEIRKEKHTNLLKLMKSRQTKMTTKK